MALKIATRARTDGFVVPCIPTLAAKPTLGPDWVHEIKHGYRLIMRRDGRAARLFVVSRARRHRTNARRSPRATNSAPDPPVTAGATGTDRVPTFRKGSGKANGPAWPAHASASTFLAHVG
jgi:hypothetical protein